MSEEDLGEAISKAVRMAECPNNNQHGIVVCREGYLWELTYSEMGPPNQRQLRGPCPLCNKEEYDREWGAYKNE